MDGWREYIIDTVKEIARRHPLLFSCFFACLRENGTTYIKYRTERFKYLERQGRLFGHGPRYRPRARKLIVGLI
jgi:hypothetical protein